MPLEVLVNDNRAALLQDDAAFGGEPQVARRVLADTGAGIGGAGGRPGSRPARASPARSDMRTLLQAFGALDDDLRYAGSVRAGYAEPPGRLRAARTSLPGAPARGDRPGRLVAVGDDLR